MKRKILHMIETSGPGGAENMLLSMLDTLDPQRYESHVLLLKAGWLSGKVEERGITPKILPQRGTLDIGWIRDIRKWALAEGFELLHSHEFAMNSYGAILSAVSGIPGVATVHGRNYYGEKLQRRILYRFASRQLQMVAVSDDIADYLVGRVGVSRSRISVIENGINVARYIGEESVRRSTRQDLGVRDDELLIGAVGNLYQVKGHQYLVEAFAGLADTFENVKLVIAGRGDQEPMLRELMGRRGVQDRVTLLGFREDVPALLQAMDIFVMPSLSEGLPLSVLEAMASGTPVIATAVGGLPRLLEHGGTGLLVPSRDPAALRHELEKLARDRDLARSMAEQACRLVNEKYSVASMVSGYETLYDRAVRER